jgi:hypothetical protein
MTRKKFLDLGLGTLGAVGLGACGDDGAADDGNDTTTGGDDDDDDATVTNTDPSSPTSLDDGSSSVTDPTEGSSSGTDPTLDSSSGPGESSDDGSTTSVDSSSSGPGEESSSTGNAACVDDPSVTIANNHMHSMTVTIEEVMAMEDVDYDIQGGSIHTHMVSLTADHFMMLSMGLDVMVASTMNSMHSHMITVTCG